MRCRKAFTLVEVLIVVVVIGILAAIVVPLVSSSTDNARINTLSTTTRSIQSKIQEEWAHAGAYPATINPAWFGRTTLPEHPQNTLGVAALESVSTAGLQHPADKVLASGVPGAYWYNASTGAFRARVAAQGSSEATLAMYNLVNGSAETALGNYAGAGGSSGSGGSGGGSGSGSGGSGSGSGGGTGGWGS